MEDATGEIKEAEEKSETNGDSWEGKKKTKQNMGVKVARIQLSESCF